MSEIENFEMSESDKPEDVVAAAQRSFVTMLKQIINHCKAELCAGQAGLTWAQLDYLVEEAAKKQPKIIVQELPQ